MKLIILRHGRTKENDAGILQGQSVGGELTSEGITQAKKVGEYLKNFKIDKIYSSDLKRTVDTTNYVLENVICKDVTYLKEIREVNLGTAEGKYKNDLSKEDINSRETDEELKNRAKIFLNIIKNLENNQTILIVTHNTIAEFLITEILDGEIYDLFSNGIPKNCSISIFNYNGNKFKTEIYNSVKHLE